MDFDETRLYYSHQQLQVQQQSGDAEESQDGDAIRNVVYSGDDDESAIDLQAVRRHFREFLRA